MTRLLAALTFIALATSPALARRFVLAIGENVGDAGKPRLAFTHDDAKSIVAVMTELGGTTSDDSVTVLGTSADELRHTLALVRSRLQSGAFDELVVYVSSHAADGFLLLRGTRFPLSELERFIDDAPAPVVTAVLDVCQAGWLVREKGLEPVGRSVRVEPAAVRGRVLIMSSGATEASQESDRFGGSTFTHHLVAGLRGPADVSRDGRVTLNEAFAYAQRRTLEATFGSTSGTQTPRYDIDLQGERELVMTELAQSRGRVIIDVPAAGEWLVGPLGGEHATRFAKGSGRVVFAVAPGTYRIATIEGDTQREGTIVVATGVDATVHASDLVSWRRTSVRDKSGIVDWTFEAGAQLGTPVVSDVGLVDAGVVVALSFADDGWVGPLTFYDLALGVRFGDAGAYAQEELELAAALGPDWPIGDWHLRVGPSLAGLLVVQSGDKLGTRTTLLPRVGVLGEATVVIGPPLYFGMRVNGGAQWVSTQVDASARAFVALTLTLGFTL